MELYRYDLFNELDQDIYKIKSSNLGYYIFYISKNKFVKYNIETKEERIIFKFNSKDKFSSFKLSFDDKFTLILFEFKLIYLNNDDGEIIETFDVKVDEYDFNFTINNDLIFLSKDEIYLDKLNDTITNSIDIFNNKYLYFYNNNKRKLYSEKLNYKNKPNKIKKYLNKDFNFCLLRNHFFYQESSEIFSFKFEIKIKTIDIDIFALYFEVNKKMSFNILKDNKLEDIIEINYDDFNFNSFFIKDDKYLVIVIDPDENIKYFINLKDDEDKLDIIINDDIDHIYNNGKYALNNKKILKLNKYKLIND